MDLAKTAIVLDVDGTLLDIAGAPDEVRVPSDVRDVLVRLDGLLNGALAFISGRTLADLDRLFAPSVFTAAGCHGGEVRYPGGAIVSSIPLPATIRARLAHLSRLGQGIVVEDKVYTLAIHYRLAPELAPRLLNAVEEIRPELDRANLQVLHGKAVVEIKPKSFDKGTALRHLMAFAPFTGRRPVFAGDDVTDRDVFAVLPAFDGIGISVGSAISGAAFVVESPSEIRRWLAHIAHMDRA